MLDNQLRRAHTGCEEYIWPIYTTTYVHLKSIMRLPIQFSSGGLNKASQEFACHLEPCHHLQ